MTSKTKTIIMLALLALNILIAYKIYDTIIGDVRRQAKIESIDEQVIEKLKDIRDAQVAYRQMHGKFAPDFPTLINGIKNGKIAKYKKSGDKDKNPNAVVSIDTTYVDAMIEVFKTKDYPIDELGLVPPMDTATFIMEVGSVVKNDVKLPTFQVKDPHPFNPERTLQVGSLYDAIDFGNWE